MGKSNNNFHLALAHDWLVGMRGGEWVLDRLARQFGPTTLYTLVDNGCTLTDAIRACDIVTSPLQRFPGASGRLRRMYLPLMPRAVERLKVEPCDVLISTSSAVMKSIIPPPGCRHLCYCHSPARYIWHQSGDYALGAGGSLRALGLGLLRKRFQRWDRKTSSRVDRFIANSAHTAQRIKACYGREATVVYPPVRTEYFVPSSGTSQAREDWYLVVTALEPYKRTDVVIEAARKAGVSLKVAGSGSQYERLKATCGKSVQMLGRVDDDELLSLYQRAKALVFPQQEDFGIVAVEAQAAGCPVIAFDAGGARETVTQASGVFFAKQTPESILEAMERLGAVVESGLVSDESCRSNAERFSERAFDEAMAGQVGELLKANG